MIFPHMYLFSSAAPSSRWPPHAPCRKVDFSEAAREKIKSTRSAKTTLGNMNRLHNAHRRLTAEKSDDREESDDSDEDESLAQMAAKAVQLAQEAIVEAEEAQAVLAMAEAKLAAAKPSARSSARVRGALTQPATSALQSTRSLVSEVHARVRALTQPATSAPARASSSLASSSRASSSASFIFSIGARVEGRNLASTLGAFGTKWYPAVIHNTHADGSYDLHYDDGEDECHVAPHYVRVPKTKAGQAPPPKRRRHSTVDEEPIDEVLDELQDVEVTHDGLGEEVFNTVNTVLQGLIDSIINSQEGESIAGGGCVAVAVTKLGVFSSQEEAIERLDWHTRDWTTLRDDKRNTENLGIPGLSWAREVIKRTIIDAGFDYHIVKKGPTLEATLREKDGLFLIDGIANDSYLEGKKRVKPYPQDGKDDNPRNPARKREWQHVFAVKDGILRREHVDVELRWLWLDAQGEPNEKNGIFIRIDKVYRLKKKAVAATAEMSS